MYPTYPKHFNNDKSHMLVDIFILKFSDELRDRGGESYPVNPSTIMYDVGHLYSYYLFHLY